MSLESEMRTIIRDSWEAGDRNVLSNEVYDKLVAQGRVVEPNSMKAVYDRLESEGLIAGVTKLSREGAIEHGAFSVTWADPSL